MEKHSLKLGQHSSRERAIFRIKSWSEGAKSFTITKISRYHYGVLNGGKCFRNNFIVKVKYFSRKNEGKYQIPQTEKHSLRGSFRRKEFWGTGERTLLVKNY